MAPQQEGNQPFHSTSPTFEPLFAPTAAKPALALTAQATAFQPQSLASKPPMSAADTAFALWQQQQPPPPQPQPQPQQQQQPQEKRALSASSRLAMAMDSAGFVRSGAAAPFSSTGSRAFGSGGVGFVRTARDAERYQQAHPAPPAPRATRHGNPFARHGSLARHPQSQHSHAVPAQCRPEYQQPPAHHHQQQQHHHHRHHYAQHSPPLPPQPMPAHQPQHYHAPSYSAPAPHPLSPPPQPSLAAGEYKVHTGNAIDWKARTSGGQEVLLCANVKNVPWAIVESMGMEQPCY